MSNEVETELLPCPICGAFANVRFVGDGARRADNADWWVGCSTNHNRARTKEQAIAMWNTRTSADIRTQAQQAAEKTWEYLAPAVDHGLRFPASSIATIAAIIESEFLPPEPEKKEHST